MLVDAMCKITNRKTQHRKRFEIKNRMVNMYVCCVCACRVTSNMVIGAYGLPDRVQLENVALIKWDILNLCAMPLQLQMFNRFPHDPMHANRKACSATFNMRIGNWTAATCGRWCRKEVVYFRFYIYCILSMSLAAGQCRAI